MKRSIAVILIGITVSWGFTPQTGYAQGATRRVRAHENQMPPLPSETPSVVHAGSAKLLSAEALAVQQSEPKWAMGCGFFLFFGICAVCLGAHLWHLYTDPPPPRTNTPWPFPPPRPPTPPPDPVPPIPDEPEDPDETNMPPVNFTPRFAPGEGISWDVSKFGMVDPNGPAPITRMMGFTIQTADAPQGPFSDWVSAITWESAAGFAYVIEDANGHPFYTNYMLRTAGQPQCDLIQTPWAPQVSKFYRIKRR